MSLQENPLTGRKADVIKAAHLCAEAALRLVKPGNQVKTLPPWPLIWPTALLFSPHLINITLSLSSEHAGHRSLEQDCKVIQVLPYWGWVFVNIKHLQALWFQRYTFAERNLKCLTQSSYVYRHAVPSAQTTCDWRGENYHPKPNRPAKVSPLSKCFKSLTWWVFNQWMILSLCCCRKDHEKAEFEVHEVYAVDVLISTGEGKVRGNLVYI